MNTPTFNNNNIKTLSLTFSLPIYTRQIQNWRGAFIQMAGWQDDRFHNHDNRPTEDRPPSAYHYRYPLIQYRVRQGKASLFAINEGVPALQQVLATNDWNIIWQGKPTALQVEDLRMNEHYLRTTPQPHRYKMFKWIALTADSFQEWETNKNMIQRTMLLQKKLENHLIGLFKGLQWDWQERIEVSLELVRKVQPMQVHGVKLLAFDIEFSTNVLLPTGIAIGKSVSHGFGWIVPHQKRITSETLNKKEQIHYQ